MPAGLVEHLRDRLAKALVGVGDHKAHALQPTLDELGEEGGPELVVLARTGRRSEYRAFTLLGDRDRYDGGDRDYPASLANLVEGRVEPEVGQEVSIGLARKLLTSSSSTLQILETSEREIPSIPSARTR